MIEVGLVALLRANQNVMTALPDGIRASLAPEGVKRAAAVYQIISAIGDNTLDRTGGVFNRRYQFTAYAPVSDDAKAAQDAIRQALDGYQGELEDGTRVLLIRRDTELDQFENETRLFSSSIDFFVTYIPTA